MPLTDQERETLIDAISRLGQDDDQEDESADDDGQDDDQPSTVAELLTQTVRNVLAQAGIIDADDDETDEDEDELVNPLLDLAALRHIVATRFPDLDLDAELALVSGLELSDDGEVTGEASYEPSDAMRGTVRSRRGRRQPNPKEGRRREAKTLADMDVHEFAERMKSEGIEDAETLFRSASLRETGQKNAAEQLAQAFGRSNGS